MKIIVYQGAEEKYRVRTMEDDGTFLMESQLYVRQGDAKNKAQEWSEQFGGVEIEVRETIQEVADREAAEAKAETADK